MMAECSAPIETVAAVVPVTILAEIKNVVDVFTFCFGLGASFMCRVA
ncbi:hypothetical protein R5R35_009758 [Gryllus longicercus]|uniref:Uncharacterized protein n=1 Tax=Gryllus longicercus TaxID=2509291 RepID=A0AAN9Z972_9ORTH